eukprot:194751-Ditylum_brightwellii.AAC.1
MQRGINWGGESHFFLLLMVGIEISQTTEITKQSRHEKPHHATSLDNIEQLESRLTEPDPIMAKEEEEWFQWESYVGVPVPK